MPYRRLPNTDQARIRAFKAIVQKGEEENVRDLAVSLDLLSKIENYLPKFEAASIYYRACFNKQSAAGKKHLENIRQARLYVSHFIQVLNMAVIRSEIRPQYKSLYGLSVKEHVLPDLSTDTAILEWGKKIIAGEEKRISQGGVPIYNPTIAKVKVLYDIFAESYEQQKNYQLLTARSLEDLTRMRPKADELILQAWNQIEKKFGDITDNKVRMRYCTGYGMVYYYRPDEIR